MKPRSKVTALIIIAIALAIKLSLFTFAAIHAPQSKFMPDSDGYLELSKAIVSKGSFAAQDEKGGLTYETLRTPGYPVFLALLNGVLKVPLSGIIFLRLIMTLVSALIVYKTAAKIDPNIAFLSMLIMLFDVPITIFSLVLLTETLFMFLISIFALCFVLYLKRGNANFLLLSAFLLAASVYVRPIGYYLGFAVTLFIVYSNGRQDLRKTILHAAIFFIVVYSLLGIWQARNYIRCGNIAFSSLEHFNLSDMGLFKSYARNADRYTKGLAPFPYYVNVFFRCLLSLITRPGTLKYFHSDTLTILGKIIAYPWMMFWLTGLVLGLFRVRKNIYLQFILCCASYFVVVSICGAMWIAGERFRVPIMPFIAVISAHGWLSLFKSKHC